VRDLVVVEQPVRYRHFPAHLWSIFESPKRVTVEACFWPSRIEHQYRDRLPEPGGFYRSWWQLADFTPIERWWEAEAYNCPISENLNVRTFCAARLCYFDPERFTIFEFYDWEPA
jgi:hypothetical protein